MRSQLIRPENTESRLRAQSWRSSSDTWNMNKAKQKIALTHTSTDLPPSQYIGKQFMSILLWVPEAKLLAKSDRSRPAKRSSFCRLFRKRGASGN